MHELSQEPYLPEVKNFIELTVESKKYLWKKILGVSGFISFKLKNSDWC
jgi:hypothetical protein